MTIAKIVSIGEFKQMLSYKNYTNSQEEQQTIKHSLLDKVRKAYGDKFYRLAETTKEAIDMLCFLATEKGFIYAGDDYLGDRHDTTDRSIRNHLKFLRESGIIFTIYRRSTKQNGRGKPVHLFVDHPYFSYWKDFLNLADFQADFQAEKAQTPCESKNVSEKTSSTINIPINKQEKDNYITYSQERLLHYILSLDVDSSIHQDVRNIVLRLGQNIDKKTVIYVEEAIKRMDYAIKYIKFDVAIESTTAVFEYYYNQTLEYYQNKQHAQKERNIKLATEINTIGNWLEQDLSAKRVSNTYKKNVLPNWL